MIPAILVIRRSKGSCNNCQNGWVGAAHVGSSPLQQIMGAQGKRESDCGFSHIGVHGGIYHQLLLMCNVVLWVCCCRLWRCVKLLFQPVLNKRILIGAKCRAINVQWLKLGYHENHFSCKRGVRSYALGAYVNRATSGKAWNYSMRLYQKARKVFCPP